MVADDVMIFNMKNSKQYVTIKQLSKGSEMSDTLCGE